MPLEVCVHVLVCGCGCVSLSLSQYVCVCVFVIVCACACLPLASEYPPTVYLLQHALRKTHSLTRAQERLVTFIILTHAHTYAHTQALSMRVKLLNHQPETLNPKSSRNCKPSTVHTNLPTYRRNPNPVGETSMISLHTIV